ncbi:MAG TPA: hypothetical protein DEF34_09650 [Desulfotomaculum sp.]|nr:hypothetical protein [Desulfotomaculum sp.]
MKKIFVMSSVHQWNDGRIFYKEASSLAQKFKVQLHALADFELAKKNGVDIYGLPRYKKRYLRPINWLRLLWRALIARADVYHFHDPELIPLGLVLKVFGRRVVFDMHEDYTDAIKHKQWIPRVMRGWVSKAYNYLEKICCRFFDAVIFAELAYKDSYHSVNVRQEDILNYPVFHYQYISRGHTDTRFNLVYAGTISETRGAVQMLEALHLVLRSGTMAHLYLIGPIYQAGLEEKLKRMVNSLKLNGSVTLTGRVTPEEVYSYYSRADIGLALLHPVENNTKSLVTKLFEYMSAGIPVLASNFPSWQSLLSEVGAGVTVDPLNPEAIASEIRYLADNPAIRSQMGKHGCSAYRTRFNWQSEEKKLWDLYRVLLSRQ